MSAGNGFKAHVAMTEKVSKSILRLLVQCNRLAPALTPIQISIMLVLFNEHRPMNREEIASILNTTRNQVIHNSRFMLAKNGQQVISMDNGYELSLTELGERYCRNLITNTRHFVLNELEHGTHI